MSVENEGGFDHNGEGFSKDYNPSSEVEKALNSQGGSMDVENSESGAEGDNKAWLKAIEWVAQERRGVVQLLKEEIAREPLNRLIIVGPPDDDRMPADEALEKGLRRAASEFRIKPSQAPFLTIEQKTKFGHQEYIEGQLEYYSEIVKRLEDFPKDKGWEEEKERVSRNLFEAFRTTPNPEEYKRWPLA